MAPSRTEGNRQAEGLHQVLRLATVTKRSGRVFKTAWFTRAARKAHISDEELCSAIRRVMRGQEDDLGGGVFKERLRKNQSLHYFGKSRSLLGL